MLYFDIIAMRKTWKMGKHGKRNPVQKHGYLQYGPL